MNLNKNAGLKNAYSIIRSPNLRDNLNARNLSVIYQQGVIMYNNMLFWAAMIAREIFALKRLSIANGRNSKVVKKWIILQTLMRAINV